MTHPSLHSAAAPLIVLIGGLAAGAAEPLKEDSVIYRHASRYSAFPSLRHGAADRLWVGFGWNTTRSHYGRAAGGQSGSVAVFSPDGGRTWFQAGEDPEYAACPERAAALVQSDGTIVRVGPRMHEVLPGEKKEELVRRGIAVKEWPDGHISACYRVTMARKGPGDDGWKSRDVDLPPFASMGGFGTGCVLPDDTILKPVYGRVTVDDPAGRTWVLRSADGGDTWQLVTVAYDGVRNFNEAELLALPGGRVLAMIRNDSGGPMQPSHEIGFLWQCVSDDGGKTWSEPTRTDLWGYPPHLLLLENGDVLCTYGYRRAPYGIRACFSRDGAKTWDVEREVILRSDALPDGPGPGKGSPGDLGYPRSAELSDGSLLTVYYITLGDGVTHVAATRWSPDYLGPEDLPRGAAALPKPDPTLEPEHLVGETGPIRLVYGLMQSFIPTRPQVKMVAVRVSERSAEPDLEHTHGLSVVVRKPNGNSWWTEWLGESNVLAPEEVSIGGFNTFVFNEPVPVTPGETYVLTVYNKDYVGGGETRLKDGLSGDHAWYLNSGNPRSADYPNGGVAPGREADLGFKVYDEIGALPEPGR